MDKRKRMADTGNITVDMYYIMDSSSNYYRLDADGQLVVAADKDQAGIFSIKEIRNKLGTGKKSGFYRIASVNGNMIWNMSNMEEFNKNNTEEYTEADVWIEEPEYDISKLDWCDYLKNFCYLISTATNYMGQLQKQISDVDLEICDLLHYIELCEIEENEDEKLILMIKNARQRRRDAKDALDAVKQFQESIGNQANLIKAKKVLQRLEVLDQRKYIPRKFPELFEKGVKGVPYSVPRLPKQEECTEKSLNGMQQDRRVVHMSEIRRETVFDTKKMDWLQFAKDQIEFYKNAEQHIVNLQIDINDIDMKIENTLKQIEEGSFSAVQGYLAFKKLRDLRNERKEKQQELEKVSILVDPFNCEAIQEHFEDSVEKIQTLISVKKESEQEEAG